jgi:hypothetical protein
MEAARSRLGSLLEWLAAAAIIFALVAAGSFAFREFRSVRAVTPVIAEEAQGIDPPAAVPSRSVSVPMLLFEDGSQVRVGDRESDVASRIGSDAQLGADAVERSDGRTRVTRIYQHLGSRFALVFESERVVAIFR